jgi:glycosyltransferase involved in cell wall biosynthesis
MTGRLLALAAVDHPGGAETTLPRLLGGLSARGWAIALTTTPGRGPLSRQAIDAGYPWHALPLGGLGRRAGARALASWPVARTLARQADVVYLNGGVCGRVLPALGRRRPSRARVVLHIHDIVRRVPRFWRGADVVLAASDAVAARLLGLNTYVVYPPADPDPPPAAALWPTGKGPVVGFVGRLERRKGAPDLARAAPAIRRGAPDARIVIVGEEPRGVDSVCPRRPRLRRRRAISVERQRARANASPRAHAERFHTGEYVRRLERLIAP